MSAMQLMVAGETEAQFVRRPFPPNLNMRRRAHSSKAEREQKPEQHLVGHALHKHSQARCRLISGLTCHAASQKLQPSQ